MDDDSDDDVDDDDDGDDDKTLRRGCGVKRLKRHMARDPFERGGRGGGKGGGGSLSPGRSGIRGPARPFASQSRTQGSPLGGYLS